MFIVLLVNAIIKSRHNVFVPALKHTCTRARESVRLGCVSVCMCMRNACTVYEGDHSCMTTLTKCGIVIVHVIVV